MATRGRPSKFTHALADRICERLTAGESLRAVCRDESFPDEVTVRRWATEDRHGFSAQYTKAREAGYLAMSDEVLEIADYGTNDTYLDNDGNKRTDYDVVQRSRLRVDTRKWLLSKMLPKVFGDKIEHQHGATDELLSALDAAGERARNR